MTEQEEKIPMMWLAAMQQPDSRSINEFRGVRMQVLMDELFETMILKLIEENYISMGNYFLDGTKIEADANRYSFVWRKATAHFEEKLQETLQHTHEVTELELGVKKPAEELNEGNIEHILEETAIALERKVET